MVIQTCAKYVMPVSKDKKVGNGSMQCQKTLKFDLEVKVQGENGVKNEHNTLSHVETPMCQIWSFF